MVTERLILCLYKDFFSNFGYIEPSEKIAVNLKEAGGRFHGVAYGTTVER
jgi:hypothetical protein